MPKSTIGIQGGQASYHEIAAHKLRPGADLAYLETFADLFAALRRKQVDSVLVAIANNRAQFITEPYEEVIRHPDNLSIVGEVYLKVEHALLGLKGATLKNISEVHSQAPALDQCRIFLDEKLPHASIVEQHDTAASAKMVSEWNDPTKVAIASPEAGKLYGLSVIQSVVQDDPDNITRFLEIKLASYQPVKKATKTTMLLETPQVAGALVGALLPFKKAGINLSNLHSRIIPNTPFHMMFFVEFEAGLQEARTIEVLNKLRADGYKCRVLGSYKAAKIPN